MNDMALPSAAPPACLSAAEVDVVLEHLARAHDLLEVAHRDASRHASAANNLTGLACVLRVAAEAIDAARSAVDGAAIRA